MRIAVVAHQRKVLGDGLVELRKRLAEEVPGELIWHEVSKSRKAPKKARRAVKDGAELVLVWGGDGMVQRCADALAGSGVPIGILPAGTANLLATNLGIPHDLEESLRIALYGARRPLDLGKIKGEHFAVMAGAGFDASMIAEADGDMKDRAGRLAYVWTGLRHVNDEPVDVHITVDGATWFTGPATCVLLGNVSMITGGVRVFDGAQPDDGLLHVGVTTAEGALAWARTMARMALDRSEHSPFVQITQGKRIDIRFSEPTVYELDGGARTTAKRLKAKVVPGAIRVCVPVAAP